MRFFAFIAMLFLCGRAPAESPWSANWGMAAGFGSSDFQEAAHPVQSNPANLFSMLSGSIPVATEAGSGGGLGLQGNLGWDRIAEIRAEAWWVLRDAKVTEDLGSGTQRRTDFVREAGEGDLMLRLGWPIAIKGGTQLRPLAEGGAFGNRTLNAHREIGISGGTSTLIREWDGVPNEDWGWLAGAGLEWLTPQVAPGLEFRYYEGQKDLDPKGPNELKSKSWMIILFLGF